MAKKQKEIPMMLTQSKVKQFVSENGGQRVGGDFVAALNEQLAKTIEDAQRRCTDNNRGTLQPRDL
jgi:histone H3/H4